MIEGMPMYDTISPYIDMMMELIMLLYDKLIIVASYLENRNESGINLLI